MNVINLDIFRKSDSSGRMSKENFVLKNFKEEYDYIINYTQLRGLSMISFKEKVYITINELDTIPTCKNINCSNTVLYKNLTLGYLDYCSKKCVSSDVNIKKIKEKKSIEKFGTKTPAESLVVRDKIINTNNLRYGGNSPMSSKEIQNLSKSTILKNWGVDNPAKSSEIMDRRVKTFKLNIDKYKESYRKTSIDRYGVEHPWMNKAIHDKTIKSFYINYIDRIKSKILNHNVRFIDFDFSNNSTKLVFHCDKCCLNFNILTYQFYYRINGSLPICTQCFPISESSSINQIELYNFISENYEGEIVSNCRNVISPYEIDVYLPDMKIGFEFNGVFWHSDKFKDNNYHLKKNNLSIDNNIKLYTIWEDDWVIKGDICKSFILNKIGKSLNRIYARNCIIKEVSYLDSKKFLEKNHLQGNCTSSVRIGLYYNDELYSLMTFSKLRLPLQRLSKNRNIGHYELVRFVSKLGANIIGGASKILKYFINNYNPLQIETYSDNLISNGDVYSKLGFKYLHTSKPGYWYLIDGIRQHRFNWRKQKLIKLGHDPNKTEEEIMLELGHYRIYNAGNKKWQLIIN